MSTDKRLADLEQSFVTLTRLTESASERADTHEDWINQLGKAQAETETKLAALIDAQIKTEDAVRALVAAQRADQVRTARLEAAFVALTELAQRVDGRLAELLTYLRGAQG
jgi:hypothetical protein